MTATQEPDVGARPAERSTTPGWAALLAASVGQFLVVLDISVVNVALPDLRTGLGLGASGLQWVVNAYSLTFAGFLLLGGRAADLFGRKRVFVAGLGLFTAASLAGGFAQDPAMIITARAVQGLGAAILAPVTLSLITATFPDGPARTRAIAMWTAVGTAGGATGGLVGGLLTDYLSWRWVFLINVPVGLAVAVVAVRWLRGERGPAERQRLDLPGAVLVTAGVGLLAFGIGETGEHGWTAAGWLAAGAVLLAAFVAIEWRAREPVMPLWLLTGRDRAASYLTQLLLAGSMFGAFFFLTQYLQQVLGYGPLRAGAAFLPMVGVQFATVRTVPRILPRVGARWIVVAGTLFVGIALAWLSGLSPGDGYAAGMLGPFLLMGFGGGLAMLPLNVTILGSVGPEHSGAASGVAQAMLWSGGSLGSAAMVTAYGSAHTGHDVVSGMDTAYLTGAVFAGAALLVALFVLRVRR